MKVAVCCKIAPDAEDVVVAADGGIDVSRANWKVSEYDLNAIKAAQDMGAEAVAITVGPTDITASRLQKSLMSQGNLASLIRVADDSLGESDTAQLARILAAAVSRSGAEVALFGEGSSDRYQRVTGSQVAAELGWPCVTAVDAIEVGDGVVTAWRDLEDGIEIVELALPCVLVTTSTINVPQIPAMKAVLAAGKKPVDDISIVDLGVNTEAAVKRLGTEAPKLPGRQKVVLEGDPAEVAAELVKKLKENNVL